MRIDSVVANNRRKSFEIVSGGQQWTIPYSRLRVSPTTANRVQEVYVDSEIGAEGFTYVLADGTEDTIHMDAVLDHNADPNLMAELLLYRLTLSAQEALDKTDLSTREVIRRLGTSASQFYRLIDPANQHKSIGQVLKLLSVLGVDVEVKLKPKRVLRERVAKSRKRKKA